MVPHGLLGGDYRIHRLVALACAKGNAAHSHAVASGWLALRLSGYENKKALCAGLMSVPQLSATLAAAAVALQLQMITKIIFNAIVSLSILTTISVPSLVKPLITRGKIQFDQMEDPLAGLELDADVDEDTESPA